MTMPEVDIINRAIDEYNPFRVFALFSGGNDSVCTAHISKQANRLDSLVFIDTGIKIQKTLDHAQSIADSMGISLMVIKTPEKYEDIVLKHGFPGPTAHRYMYIMLKERAIDWLLRETKTKRSQSIMLITGVRQHESKRRMENVTGAVVKQKSRIWVAPMWNWTSEMKEKYISDNNLPRNPVKDILHVSGDCLCGAYNDKGDLEMLRAFFPEEYARIKNLQDEVIKTHPWQWDEMPPKWWKEYNMGQRFLGNDFMPLCWNCDIAARQNNMINE